MQFIDKARIKISSGKGREAREGREYGSGEGTQTCGVWSRCCDPAFPPQAPFRHFL